MHDLLDFGQNDSCKTASLFPNNCYAILELLYKGENLLLKTFNIYLHYVTFKWQYFCCINLDHPKKAAYF